MLQIRILVIFSYGGLAYKNAKFGQGFGRIWLDNLDCSYDDLNISSCSHSGWNNNDCKHLDDAAVDCIVPGKRLISKIAYFKSVKIISKIL